MIRCNSHSSKERTRALCWPVQRPSHEYHVDTHGRRHSMVACGRARGATRSPLGCWMRASELFTVLHRCDSEDGRPTIGVDDTRTKLR